MGSIFRSDEMALCQIFLSSEASYNCVAELGELGACQFRDLNPTVNLFQRKFVNEVRRCDEMERKLRHLEMEINKEGIEIEDIEENPEAPQPREMIDLEATFEKLENELSEVNINAVTLKRNYTELIELKNVLTAAQAFFDENDRESSANITQNLLQADDQKGQVQLGFIAGVIERSRMAMFELMLWRVSRGNVFIHRVEIENPLEDPVTGNEVWKSVYLTFFQGDQLKLRVKKICEGCRATMYPCPETNNERKEMLASLQGRLDDLNIVLTQTTDHKHRVLVSAAKHIQQWFIKVQKIKAIYHTLNLFNLHVTNKCFIAEAWVPVVDFDLILSALKKATEKSGSAVEPIMNRMETQETPPSYFRTNHFTKGFQNLIDSYGIGSYREVNPGLYTVTTFPFLFAIMFGDAGHGFVMFSFAFWMVYNEKKFLNKKSNSDIWNMIFGGRYIILLMGCFSMYTGIIYNDVFSKSMNIFGSSWHIGNSTREIYKYHEAEHMLNPGDRSDYSGSPYPFGIDPLWVLATNKISFQNGFKMKISIIVGVLHMLFGVILSVVNHLYFRKGINILFEFIPQILFMIGLFGYLCFLIIFKWINYGDGPEFDVEHGTSCAPSVLITFINMVLFKEDAAAAAGAHGTDEHEEFEFSEVFIHQGIHTIEYVLGSVSHTASYLRLWALSLAHGQLSEVLWLMVLKIGLSQNSSLGFIMLYITFAAWAALTVSILVLMEGLSAFLHTLRLHWVEFCSKFYEGQGNLFVPFSFKHLE